MVGGWNTVFGFGTFALFYLLLKPFFEVQYFAYTSAQVISLGLAYLNAFLCHKYITFRTPVRGKKIFIEFIRFCMTNAVIAVFDFVWMPMLVELGHLSPILAAAIIIPIRGVFSYFGHLHFSFRKLKSSVHAPESL